MSESPARQNVTFASNGDTAHGYLAEPEQPNGVGVVVIQEWWGLDDQLAGVADRLAAEGFTALAPDLFGGRVAHDADEATTYMQQLPVDQAIRDLSGAAEFLLARESVTQAKLGAVGFCMGGGFVLGLTVAAGEHFGAAVPFYGVGQGVPERYRGVTTPIQGHYGEDDQFYPVADAHALERQIAQESDANVEFFYYPAGHAFMNELDRMGTYDAASAALAWERTVTFLRSRLGATAG